MLSYPHTVNHDLTERSPAIEDWESTKELNSLIQERLLSYQTNSSRNYLLDNLLYDTDKFAKCEETAPRSGVFYEPNAEEIKMEECLDINQLLYDNSDESDVPINQIANDIDLNYFDHRKGADNNQFLYNKSINSSSSSSKNISNCKNDYTKQHNYYTTKSGCPSTATSASQSPRNVLSMDGSGYYLMNATDVSPENTIDGVNFFTDPFNYDNVLGDEKLLFYTPDNSCGPVIDITDTNAKRPSLTLNLKGTFVNEDEINTPNIIDTIMAASEQPLQFIKEREEIFNEVSYLAPSPQESIPCPSTSSPAAVSDTVDGFLSAVASPIEPAKRPGRPRKRRYDSDYEPNEDDEDEDETYTPRPSHRRRKSRDYRISKKRILYEDISEDEDYRPPKNSAESRLQSVEDVEDALLRVGKRGRPPKHLRSISSDDYSLLDPDEARYREMRDRNNEASRKSRYKRKQKEEKISGELEDLEMENVKLKAQVEELQKTVDRYRDNLMKVMLSGKK